MNVQRYTRSEFRLVPRTQWGGKETFIYAIFMKQIVKIGCSNTPIMRIKEQLATGLQDESKGVESIYIVGPTEQPRAAKARRHALERDMCFALSAFQHYFWPSSPSREHFNLPPEMRAAVEGWFRAGCPVDGIAPIAALADQLEAAA